MFRISLVTILTIRLVLASENNKNVEIINSVAGNGPANSLARNNGVSHHNVSYIDKSENLLRTPNINKYYTEHKKKPKKSPKRTIQKIIKNNKAKLRKLYVTKKTKATTKTPKIDYEKLYGPDDGKQWKSTTINPSIQKKKIKRKYSPKFSGYHMPFQKMQRKDKKEHRHTRDLSRELYILKDLDEIEFLDQDNDKDVVRAHVKSFW